MGHFVTSKDIAIDGDHLTFGKLSGLKTITGLVGGVGLVVGVLYLVFGVKGAFGGDLGSSKFHGSFAFAWLFAVFFFLTISLGGCFWTFLHNLSNAGWGTSVRRLKENLGFVFPFMILFCIPFMFPNVQQYLWEWLDDYRNAVKAHPNLSASDALFRSADTHDHLLAAKTFYLNDKMWYLRAALFFPVLGFFIWKIRNLSIKQDTDPNPGTKNLFAARGLSSFAMIAVGVTLTFMAFDWVMALDYSWFSTMFGVYVFAGSALSSMAVLILTAIILRKMGHLENVVTQEHYHIMGKFCFAFTVFWAYVSFSQFFLIWYANITEETRYFLLRNTENWNLLSLALVFLHFGLPFLALLRADVKKNTKFMTIFCIYILVMHFLDVYHMIIPERGPSVGLVTDHQPQLWISGAWLLDLLAFAIVACGFVFIYLRHLTSASLYPNRDPRILESANLHN